MNLTQFFKILGSPLKNPRWSWGGIRDDGAVILRVWQDRKVKRDTTHYMQLSHLQKYGEGQDNLGYMERLSHIELIKGGAKCYMVMCLAKNSNATPREILSFNKDDLFLGGELIEIESDWFIAIAGKVSAIDFIS
ncbi:MULTISPECIES: hypothetical protein [Pseudomonas]|uniref:hypothetical protein n=1 Tax=Pseudomonas TaxID=286 RepID=UPI000CFED4EA|nr:MULTISPECIES: hypothetical protein [Pseudomonas]PRA59730.1 hypothetical protein CQZ98_00465 [Pseudomonas sp. MYb115]QXN50372.1 hypothetical protein KW062_00915 [Pseudomonas fluorescens]WSO24687.1 hypothetical protein VUJ50_00925 [Pseudomonas fluorescens]